MRNDRPWPDRDDATYHLAPAEVWSNQAESESYVPEAFAADGFIHCTTGETNLLNVANAFYQQDHRPYVALVLDLERVAAEVRFDDEARIYPHLHGPLNREAVTEVRTVVRLADGSFVAVSER